MGQPVFRMGTQVSRAHARERAGMRSFDWEGDRKDRTAPFCDSSFRSAEARHETVVLQSNVESNLGALSA